LEILVDIYEPEVKKCMDGFVMVGC